MDLLRLPGKEIRCKVIIIMHSSLVINKYRLCILILTEIKLGPSHCPPFPIGTTTFESLFQCGFEGGLSRRVQNIYMCIHLLIAISAPVSCSQYLLLFYFLT